MPYLISDELIKEHAEIFKQLLFPVGDREAVAVSFVGDRENNVITATDYSKKLRALGLRVMRRIDKVFVYPFKKI